MNNNNANNDNVEKIRLIILKLKMVVPETNCAETAQYFQFRRNGWYGHALIKQQII